MYSILFKFQSSKGGKHKKIYNAAKFICPLVLLFFNLNYIVRFFFPWKKSSKRCREIPMTSSSLCLFFHWIFFAIFIALTMGVCFSPVDLFHRNSSTQWCFSPSPLFCWRRLASPLVQSFPSSGCLLENLFQYFQLKLDKGPARLIRPCVVNVLPRSSCSG